MVEKIALVTGASRGIGAACAVALGKAGYKVAVHYRSQEDQARQVSAAIPGSMPIKMDLSQEGACEQLVKLVRDEMGGLDVLVNNAGMSLDALLPFAKPEDFDQLVATNLRPVFLLSKYASKQMIRRKWGRIVNLSSVVGYTGNPGQALYSMTKAAITGFSKSAALDLAKFGITVNTVAPGFIQTDMTNALSPEVREHILQKVPMGRLGQAEEIAAAVKFLVSEEASYITGTTLHVNGGMYTS
jgi:3-oxoacyl-[acyl-carrier protein] reductase